MRIEKSSRNLKVFLQKFAVYFVPGLPLRIFSQEEAAGIAYSLKLKNEERTRKDERRI
jgi:hypothetical protein